MTVLRVLYLIAAAVLTGAAGLLFWQQRQEQRQTQLKLRLLDATLQVANERAQAEADCICHDIQQAIEKNQNQPQDILILQQTDDIQQRANNAVKVISILRRNLLRGQGVPQHLDEANKRAELEVAAFITRAKALVKKSMEEHMTPAEKVQVSFLALAPGEASEALLPEVLAMLSQKHATIRTYELKVLKYQRQKISCGNITFDTVGAFASAESNVVSPGETYRAELFLTTSSSPHQMQMTANGQPLPVGPDGHGHVEFIVPPTGGHRPATNIYWTGTIRTKVAGRDSIFRVKVAYTIRAN